MVASAVGYEVDCDVDYAAVEEAFYYLWGFWSGEVCEAEEEGATGELAYVGQGEGCEMDNDVGCERLGA